MPGTGPTDYIVDEYLRRNPGVTVTSKTVNGKSVPVGQRGSGKLYDFFGRAFGQPLIEAGILDQGVQQAGTTRSRAIQSVSVTPKGGGTVGIPRNATREQVDALIKTVERKRPKAQLPKTAPDKPRKIPDKPRGQPGAGGKAALLSDTPEDLTLGKPTLLGG